MDLIQPRMEASQQMADRVWLRCYLSSPAFSRSSFPQWADLPIEPVHSPGTDKAIYRLGDDMAVRLPRIYWATGQVDKWHLWLPRLAPLLPLAIRVPLAKRDARRALPAIGMSAGGSQARTRLSSASRIYARRLSLSHRS
jgi:hypothetical protein